MSANCPNCGAAIEHIYSHNCPYCKTLLNTGNLGNKQEIDLRHIHNIKLYGIERDFRADVYNLYFKGREIKIRPLFECNNEKAVCFNKSQEVGFAFQIPINELLSTDNNIRLEQIIRARIPDEIFSEVMEATIRYCHEHISSESQLIMHSLYK